MKSENERKENKEFMEKRIQMECQTFKDKLYKSEDNLTQRETVQRKRNTSPVNGTHDGQNSILEVGKRN